MRASERGFLLLTSHLGDPERRILTAPQLRTLLQRMEQGERDAADRELDQRDLMALGYRPEVAGWILELLGEEERLNSYLRRGEKLGCVPITRADQRYPVRLRHTLGQDSPGCLWTKGDLSLLGTPAVALVGSRNLLEPNREFAVEVGRQAATQGYTLVSGNARGADRAAQEACLKAGGRIISVVADALQDQPDRRRVLYISEEDFDLPFSAQRALSRNRCIHALGRRVFVAQSELGKGGTWSGVARNLRFGWSPVVCFDDGSDSTRQLVQMGAETADIHGICALMADPEEAQLSF